MLKDSLVASNPFFRFLFGYKQSRPRFVRAGRSQNLNELSAAKQAAIESLCHKLLQKQELVTSGKLQLLGLAKIKKRMGRKWKGMQKIVYETCDSVMSKHMSPSDIFIRYKDDSYLLLFTSSSPEEIELRTKLIAEEIKRALFESAGLEDIEVLQQVSRIKTANITDSGLPFPESINAAFERALGEKPQELMFVERNSANPVSRIEVDAFADSQPRIGDLDLGVNDRALSGVPVQFMPVWDEYKKRLISYLCLPVNVEMLAQDPMRGYAGIYEGLSAAEKADMDIAVLSQVVGWLEDHLQDIGLFGILCPVHYETLAAMGTHERYKKICQQIDGDMKQYILFMVMDVPQAPWISLSQAVSPLKTYGRILCAEVPLGGQTDFEALRMAGFDHVGVVLGGQKHDEGIKKSLMDVRTFVVRARKHLMHKTFVLGVNEPGAAVILAQMGVRFMAGSAVYECLREPRGHLNFYENFYFRGWQKKADQQKRK